MNRTFACSLLSLAITAPLAAQNHDLSLTAAKGASVWLRQVTTQLQQIDMAGQEIESKNVMDLTTQITVKEIGENGSVTVEARLARVRGMFGIPQMGDFDFDSIDNDPKAAGDAEGEAGGDDGFDDFGGAMPDFDKIGKAAASIAGSKFVARLGSHGTVTSIGGVEPVIEAMQKRAGQLGGQVLAAQFSKKSIENLIESAFGQRPTKPTAVGGTWKPERSEDGRQGTTTKITLTLARVTDKAFEVTGKGTVEKPEASDSKKAGESEDEARIREMQQNMEIENGTVTASSVVSREDGFLVEAKTEMSMDVTMPGPFGDMSMKHRTTMVTNRTTEAAAMQRDNEGDGKDAGK